MLLCTCRALIKNEVIIRALIEYNVIFDSSLNLGSVACTWIVKLQWILSVVRRKNLDV